MVITSYSTVVSEWSAIQESDDDEDDKGKGKGKGKAKSGKGGVLFEGGEFKFHRSEQCFTFFSLFLKYCY